MGFLYRFPTVFIAVRNISRTSVRSGLATLGIVIGVFAIASLGVFGVTLQQAAVGTLGDVGNEIVVQPAADEGLQTLSERDVRDIQRASGGATVVPLKTSQAKVSTREDQTVATVHGVTSPGDSFVAESGRVPDTLRTGALVGASLAERLDLRTGSLVQVNQRTYRVRAVLQEQSSFLPVNSNDAIVVPASDVNVDGYSQVLVLVDDSGKANATAQSIRSSLNERKQRVTVLELREFTNEIKSVFDAINIFLVGVGLISLVVAGVAILNVMLMSTVERRVEIGLLRAVGYRRMDILKIWLSEALLLGVVGGVIGGILAMLTNLLVNQIMLGDWTEAFRLSNMLYILSAFAFGVITAVVSGLYPASRAANERPVDALRK